MVDILDQVEIDDLLTRMRRYWDVPATRRAIDIDGLKWGSDDCRQAVAGYQESYLADRIRYMELTGYDWQDPAGPNNGEQPVIPKPTGSIGTLIFPEYTQPPT